MSARNRQTRRTKLALIMWEHLMSQDGAGLSWQERADLFWILYNRQGEEEMRLVHEQTVYSRENLEQIAKNFAKMSIIGDLYVGNIQTQSAEWRSDGSIVVITTHTPAVISNWRNR